MCIILAKNKGVDIPTDEVIRTCFENNPDGAGLMYQVGDYVKIEKGFMNVEKLLRRVHALNKKLDLKNKSFVIHFRIGTSGLNDKKTTHPFPITNDFDELRTLSLKTKMAMVHNGIIWEYTKKDSILSDTQNFVKDYVSMLYELNENFLDNKRVRENLRDMVGTSKLCFLNSNDELVYIGDFIKDEETGLMFSNTTYKNYKYKYTYYNYGKNNVINEWDDWNDYPINNIYKDEDIIEYENLMILSDDLFIQYDNGNLNQVGCDWLAIDKFNNLYEILDYDANCDYIVKLISKNVEVYDNDFKLVDFVGGGYNYM